ncbi:Uncharacterised protein [Collinsella intestinalis]|nr:Uncharacterised protein [Collinsella intestinalis]
MPPASTAWPPNQTMATEMMFMSIISTGIMKDIARFVNI